MPTENVYFHEAIVTNALCHGIVTHRLSPGGCAHTLLAIGAYARLGSAAAVYTHDVGSPTYTPSSNIVADALQTRRAVRNVAIIRIDKPHPMRGSGTFYGIL